MVQLNKLHQAEPEIREDLQGRIEVFDQSIRSFEKRLRAVERRLSVETPPALQAGRVSGNFSVPFQDENAGNIATGSSIFSHVPSISPESSIDTNSFLSDLAPSISAGNISSFGFSAVLHSGETPNLSAISVDTGNSSEISGTGYKISNINEVFSSISESLRSLQAAISDLSNFAYNNLKPEVEKLDIELQ